VGPRAGLDAEAEKYQKKPVKREEEEIIIIIITF
jgi:hypothetical protein